MKKMFLVLTAVMLAVGFSSFKTATLDSYYYQDDSMQWQPVPAGIDVETLCPADVVVQCQLTIAGKKRPIFDANHNPWLTRSN